MKKKLLVIIGFLLLVTLPVSAAIIRTGEEYSLIDTEIVEEDFLAFGGEVTISGEVRDDLVVAGGRILLNGSVGSDVLVFGGNIDALGMTGDDLRLVGGQIRVGDRVGGDAVILGGYVQILSGVSIGEDLIVAGGRVVIDGDVSGNLKVYAGEVKINGRVDGDVELYISDEVILGENAHVGGNITYAAPHEAVIEEGTTILGVTTFNETRITKDIETFISALFGLLFITKILALLTIGLLGVFIFRKFSHLLVTRAVNNIGTDILRGLVVLIISPVLLFFFFITTIGFYVGTIGLFAFITFILLSKVYAGIIFGALLSKWFYKEVTLNWQWTIMGITLLQIISLIPIVGPLIVFGLFLVTFGALAYIIYQRVWLNRV